MKCVWCWAWARAWIGGDDDEAASDDYDVDIAIFAYLQKPFFYTQIFSWSLCVYTNNNNNNNYILPNPNLVWFESKQAGKKLAPNLILNYLLGNQISITC